MGPVIKFPFRVTGKQPERCGYPGFNLSCNDFGETVITLPETPGGFVVNDIDYASQIIRISDPDNCLSQRILNLSLAGSPFRDPDDMRYTILRCMIPLPMLMVPCGGNMSKSVIAVPDFVEAPPECRVAENVSIPTSVGRDDPAVIWRDGVVNWLELRWEKPDCRDCGSRNKVCGFSTDQGLEIGCSDPPTNPSRASVHLGAKVGVPGPLNGQRKTPFLLLCPPIPSLPSLSEDLFQATTRRQLRTGGNSRSSDDELQMTLNFIEYDSLFPDEEKQDIMVLKESCNLNHASLQAEIELVFVEAKDGTISVATTFAGHQGGIPRSAEYGIIVGAAIPSLLCIIGLLFCGCRKIKNFTLNSHNSQVISELPIITIMELPPMPTAGAGAGAGLDLLTIQSYPKMVLGENWELPKPNGNTCPICLSEYQSEEILRSIPDCNHYFHANCIDEWLGLNATCPLCRKSPESLGTESSHLSSLSLSSSTYSPASSAS
nr:putative RING-H2 finger protein ATL21A [Ipomoea batatas]